MITTRMRSGLAVVAFLTAMASCAESASPHARVLGSGMSDVGGRDGASQLVACAGPACPDHELPVSAFVVDTHHAYAEALPGTRYIAPVADGTTASEPGYACCTTATFENAFELPNGASSVALTLATYGDNQVTASINGMPLAGQTSALAASNYVGSPTVTCTAFVPASFGPNRLHVTLSDGGGALAVDYRAVVTYSTDQTDSGASCDPTLAVHAYRNSARETADHLVAAARAATGIPSQIVRTLKSQDRLDTGGRQ